MESLNWQLWGHIRSTLCYSLQCSVSGERFNEMEVQNMVYGSRNFHLTNITNIKAPPTYPIQNSRFEPNFGKDQPASFFSNGLDWKKIAGEKQVCIPVIWKLIALKYLFTLNLRLYCGICKNLVPITAAYNLAAIKDSR